MSRHGTNETMGFNNLHSGYEGNYYGYMSLHQGYGGFDYADAILFMSRSTWTSPNGVGYQYQWCYNGFLTVNRGHGEAWIYKSGMMETANLAETFSLKSMTAASSWDTDAEWAVNSYVYANGKLNLKASDVLTISQNAEKVDFAALGSKSDFQKISAVSFVLLVQGQAGFTCGYGNLYGYQMAFDNLKVHWNGKIPRGGHSPLAMTHAHHHVTALPVSLVHAAIDHAAHEPGNAAHHGQDTYHSQLGSLDAVLGRAGPAHDLTDQFALPQPQIHLG